MRITRHEEFEMAHVLPDYPGGCGNLHGHSYKIEVTLEGPQNFDQWGMILDFNTFKIFIKDTIPDHKFAYNAKDTSPIEKDILAVLNKYGCATEGYPFCTTAENMCKYFAENIDSKLKSHGWSNLNVVEVKLWETSNSYAQYVKED